MKDPSPSIRNRPMAAKNQTPFERTMAAITWTAALATIGVLLYLVLFVLAKGLPHIRPSLFALKYNSENLSLTPALISTAMITVLALGVSVPLGVFAAIYLTEYASRGSRGVSVLRIATETLSGIPSIVYGLFGLLFFVTFLGWGFSLVAGAFTLSMMTLPLIIRAAEEALLAVPDTYREGAYGLGAGKLRTVFRVVLPSAMPGILAGIVLAIGRIVGETAALIYTAGTVAQIPQNPMMSARTLSMHMYALSSEGLYTNQSFATGVVLLLVTMLMNLLSERLAKKIGGRR